MENNTAVILEKEPFVCERLVKSSENIELISTFRSKYRQGDALANYLYTEAFNDQDQYKMRTYIVKDKNTGELVGYFSLKAGMVSDKDGYHKIKINGREEEMAGFNALPGIELVYFAVNGAYSEAHAEYKGLGMVIFYYFICPIIKQVSELIGVHFIFLYSLNQSSLIEYYKTLKFYRLGSIKEEKLHNRVRPITNTKCIFMCQRIENLY